MNKRTPQLRTVTLPDFGMPSVEPVIPAATYEARIDAARARARTAGLDALVVYADREHSANLAYLTGFDPRFEEALLILIADRPPALLLGNEMFGYADTSPVKLKKVLYQTLGLMGQSRADSEPLELIFREEGIKGGCRVGTAGWKYFDESESADPVHAIEIPAYIVDVLRSIVGREGAVVNAGALFMNPADGLRVINEVDQLAAFEFAACQTSGAVRNLLTGIRPGISEFQAAGLLGLNGMPQSCHLMLSSGARASYGLPSPSTKVIERGDRVTVAFGVWGALNCRAGFAVASEDELPAEIGDYLDRLVYPYFEAIAEWYETVGIGVPGGALFEIVERRLGDPFFGIFLNPGHLLHLDEWVHTPIAKGSEVPLRSGMALQVDVIPATGTDYFTSNIEDGIALADRDLRDAFARRYPEAWARIQARRAFMAEELGIRLKEEVLPFSNIPAYLPPFWLNPERVVCLAPAA